ncbi:MAG: cupredoxin domain-containing protein [Gammaproteobacteria bacterium]
MNVLYINIAGLIVIGFIVYWFWLSRPVAVKTIGKEIDIIVDNGVYTPASIEIKAGEAVVLNFLRKDASPCAEKVIFAGLNISKELPINKKESIKLKIDQPGEYEFTCQMQMYRGRLIVE